MTELKRYIEITGYDKIAEIYKKSTKLAGKKILNINSTNIGGGVAEMLKRFLPLMNEANVDVDWRLLHANNGFFSITKEFHNALQGGKIDLTEDKKKKYLDTLFTFSKYAKLNYDLIVIHDPQPLALIEFYFKKQPWINRLHIDLSSPDRDLWEFLKQFFIKYDLILVSNEKFIHKDVPVDQKIIYPVIDPLSNKNKELSRDFIHSYLKNYNIKFDKPIIAQISRFDKWKDPIGVIDIYQKVLKKIDARLILCGNMASDDPEGEVILKKVQEKAKDLISKGDLIILTVEDDLLVNAIQTISDVIIQKSLKEGFGLVVAEALWKKTPVVASNVGGIPLQIIDGKNGFLLEPDDIDGFAEKIVELIKNKKLNENMGAEGKEHIKNNFIITNLISNYLDIYISLIGWNQYIYFHLIDISIKIIEINE